MRSGAIDAYGMTPMPDAMKGPCKMVTTLRAFAYIGHRLHHHRPQRLLRRRAPWSSSSSGISARGPRPIAAPAGAAVTTPYQRGRTLAAVPLVLARNTQGNGGGSTTIKGRMSRTSPSARSAAARKSARANSLAKPQLGAIVVTTGALHRAKRSEILRWTARPETGGTSPLSKPKVAMWLPVRASWTSSPSTLLSSPPLWSTRRAEAAMGCLTQRPTPSMIEATA